jgi:thiol-disulfide isomerase/thioredoxin
VRIVVSILGISLLLGLAGCHTAPKKPGSNGAGPPGSDPLDRRRDAPLPSGSNTAPVGTGILAGQVIDRYDRRVPNGSILVVAAETTSEAPIDVPVDGQGYFTILKLDPGQSYKLIARVKDGERILTGTTVAKPPDPRLLIRVSEDLASPSTPPPQKPPEVPQAQPKDAKSAPPPGKPLGVVIDPPIAIPGEDRKKPEKPDRFELPPTPGHTSENDPFPGKPVPPGGRNQRPDLRINVAGPTPAPSCVLVGKRLDNFALEDLDGNVWEYRKNKKGKLLLLDFWGTHCKFCVQGMPHLINLQRTFGEQGLEIVGIAYETGPREEQVQKVQRVVSRVGVNYKLLLGGERGAGQSCPVKTQFGVALFPTLFLIDENGRIVWESEGLDARKQWELEQELRRRLGGR